MAAWLKFLMVLIIYALTSGCGGVQTKQIELVHTGEKDIFIDVMSRVRVKPSLFIYQYPFQIILLLS